MQGLYKVDIFRRDLSGKSFAPISEQNIAFDYLANEKSSITVKSIVASKGDYASITDFTAKTIYQGIVDDVETDTAGKMTLQLRSLLSVFDTDIYVDTLPTGTIEEQLESLISANFASNPDTLQNLTGLTITKTTTTAGALPIQSPIFNLYDLLANTLKTYSIAVNMSFKGSILTCKIGRVAGVEAIEADLKGVVERNIVLGDSFGALNKLTVINKDDHSETATFYLHTDGTIDMTDADRITPVFFGFKEVSVGSSTFSQVAVSEALSTLQQEEFDNLIELTVRIDSKVLPYGMDIGKICTVYHNGQIYKSIYTGYEINRNIVKLIFGCVRADLTKMLVIEKRG